MAISFNKKTWVDRDVENPNGRIITDVNTGVATQVNVAMNEGEVYTQGDALVASNWNDLEDRIEIAFNSIPESTNVTVEPTIVSGEEIATITVDGVAKKLYATDYSNALILDVTSVGV